MDNIYIDDLIKACLKEDMSLGDITTDNLIGIDEKSSAVLIAKQAGVVAGMCVARRVFEVLDEKIVFKSKAEDGGAVEKGAVIAEIDGNTRTLLKGERTALNFLQRLSGIATATRQYCDALKGLPVRVVDTRKTTPGLRLLEKYAVKAGGGHNHRFSLSDGVLIKDNHIKAAGGVKKAIDIIRHNIPHTIKIEIETETIEMVKEALEAGADIIMLDNMDLGTMREAVRLIGGRALVEASGNVSLENIYDVAETGVDIISVGSLTHSVKAFDISMRFV
ncbi:MAG: carboxylating nicotinate-nucleotide diphosphorylase [Clostridia bacterium]|nr:carboxylating nicotinate-nucleotide diphosphorylase [Clostridia bacterium]